MFTSLTRLVNLMGNLRDLIVNINYLKKKRGNRLFVHISTRMNMTQQKNIDIIHQNNFFHKKII